MISAISKKTVIAIGMLVAVARAQTPVQAIAAKIDEAASRLDLELGLEARIRAAERL